MAFARATLRFLEQFWPELARLGGGSGGEEALQALFTQLFAPVFDLEERHDKRTQMETTD